jgi:RNA recognition motif-containing protein
MSSSKLYVGNLAWTASESELTSHFSKFGSVKSVKIITDRDTGRSKGFGFVEMESADQAQDAVSRTDGEELNGRPLKVSIAQDKPREDRSSNFRRDQRSF